MRIEITNIDGSTHSIYLTDESLDICVQTSGTYNVSVCEIPFDYACHSRINGHIMFVAASDRMYFMCHLDPADTLSINIKKVADAIPSETLSFEYPKESIDKLAADILDLLREIPPKEQITNKHCSHNWKNYTGLRESYTYCTICDEKKL